jgi:hypothetical protein
MKTPLTVVEEMKREQVHERAEKEVRWFFEVMGGRVPELGVGSARERAASETIDRWFRSIPPFHRGALALLHDSRTWPKTLIREFGHHTSVVVRLECVHLAGASGRLPEELEARAIRALEEDIAACAKRRAFVQGRNRAFEPTARERKVTRRYWRAARHTRLALRAYAKARSNVPCVLPRGAGSDDWEMDDGGES